MKKFEHLHWHVLNSSKPGFRIFLMRWQPGNKIGGFGIRAFGKVFEFFSDKD